MLPHALDIGDQVRLVGSVCEGGLYAEFGVASAVRSLLDPRVWLPIVRAIARGLPPVLRGRLPLPSTSPHGGRLGLPADFLIAADGRVLAAKYGAHAYDQWSVDELLDLARSRVFDQL